MASLLLRLNNDECFSLSDKFEAKWLKFKLSMTTSISKIFLTMQSVAEGHTVIEAENGKIGVELARERGPTP